MQDWLDHLFTSENIVHIGAALYLAGFLFRDQMVLRGLVVAGDLVYIFYFLFAPDTPLWGGVFWSTMFIIVNLVMVAQLLIERRTFGLNEDELQLFSQLGTFSPGQFRKLLATTRLTTAPGDVALTREGEALKELYFVIDGDVEIRKSNGYRATVTKVFLGEVAFLLGRAATATVTAHTGTRYFTFDGARLREALQRWPDLASAMSNALNRNLAEKIAASGDDYLISTALPPQPAAAS